MNKAIGIDLGMTNSVAAVVDDTVKILLNRENQELTPSVVGMHKKEILVGQPALNRAALAPRETVVSVQRLMGRGFRDEQVQEVRGKYPYEIVARGDGSEDDVRVVLDGDQYSPLQLSSMILRKIKEDACVRLAGQVEYAVITVPASFTNRQRSATRRAGQLAGLKVQRILDKPTAAAIAFGLDNRAPTDPKTIMIYDLGSEELSVSVLEVAGDVFTPLNVGATIPLGGDDFDRKIMDHAVKHVESVYGVDPRKDAQFMFKLKEKAEQAKKNLSSMQRTELAVIGVLKSEVGDLIDVELEISRSEFERMVAGQVEKGIDLVRSGLENLGITAEKIDHVLLVGGSTYIPLVRKSLVAVFGENTLLTSVAPTRCVAYGAAMLAARLGETAECPAGHVNSGPNEVCVICGEALVEDGTISLASVESTSRTVPKELADIQNRIEFIVQRMESAIANHELEKARFYSDEERKERENMRQLREKYNFFEPFTSAPIATVVVSKSGVGGFTTISEAIKQAKPGTRIIVRPGVYQESLVIDKRLDIVGDGKVNEIVVQSTSKACISMNTEDARVRRLTLRNRSGVNKQCYAVDVPRGRLVIETCDVSSDSLSCFGIHGSGAAPIIRQCTIHGSGQHGIFVYDHGGGTVEDCDVFASTFSGIRIVEDSKPVIRQCRIHDCKQFGVSITSDGGAVIEGCDIYATILSGIIITQGGRPVVTKCRIHDGSQAGVFVTDNAGATIDDCDIFANALTGIEIREGGHPVIRRCKIHDGKQEGVRIADHGAGTLEDCDIFANAYVGVSVSKGGSPFISRSQIHHGKSAGVFVFDSGGGSIEGCDIFANTLAGVQIEKGGNPAIRGCRIHDGQNAGVRARESGIGTLEECDIFANALSGVAATLGSNPTVRRCQIHANKEYGVLVSEKAGACLEDCDIYANGMAGVQAQQGGTPIIRRCQIHEEQQFGIIIIDDGVGVVEYCSIFLNVLSGVLIKNGGNPVIRKSRLHDGKQCGILVSDGGVGTIEDCDIFGNSLAGIEIRPGGNPVIRKCRIHDGKQFGLRVEKGTGLLEDCDIFANAFSGVTTLQHGNPLIKKCRLHDGKQCGILASDDGDGVIEDCDIFSNASSGVEIQQGANPVIRRCKVRNGKQYGLLIQNNGGGTIEDCEISANALAGIERKPGSNVVVSGCSSVDKNQDWLRGQKVKVGPPPGPPSLPAAVRIRIEKAPWREMVEHAAASYPELCCGVIFGRIEGEDKVVVAARNVENVATSDKRNCWAIRPESLLEIDREARSQGLDVIGVYHSNSDIDAYFSKTDLKNSCPWYSFVVLSVKEGRFDHANSWLPNADQTAANKEELSYDG